MQFCGPPARAQRNAAQLGNAAGNNKVLLDAVVFDPEAAFDLTNHRYLCPRAGYYQINGTVSITGQAAVTPALVLIVQKTGGQSFTGGRVVGTGVAQTIAVTGSDIVECTATDYLELWFNNLSGGLVDLQNNLFSVIQVG